MCNKYFIEGRKAVWRFLTSIQYTYSMIWVERNWSLGCYFVGRDACEKNLYLNQLNPNILDFFDQKTR